MFNKISTKISSPLLQTGLLAGLALGMVSTLPASAIEVGGGRTFFEKSPHLVRSAPTHRSPGAPSTYQFTIEVPENAGEPLQAVAIEQRAGMEDIKFEPGESNAFIGDSLAGGPSVAVSSVGGEQPTEGEITVVFDQPVEPGKTVTVAVEALRNPRFGGVYEFGVTAFPVGQGSQGLYLGSGRISFGGASH